MSALGFLQEVLLRRALRRCLARVSFRTEVLRRCLARVSVGTEVLRRVLRRGCVIAGA